MSGNWAPIVIASDQRANPQTATLYTLKTETSNTPLARVALMEYQEHLVDEVKKMDNNLELVEQQVAV